MFSVYGKNVMVLAEIIIIPEDMYTVYGQFHMYTVYGQFSIIVF